MKFARAFLVSVLLIACQLQAATEVRLGFIPGGDADEVKRAAVLIAEQLQSEIGQPVSLYISKNYSGLIEAMKAKKVDFAFLTAMSFVRAESEAGAKVLLKKVWQEPFYYSVILTSQKSKITKVEHLKNKKLAFVEENSTSGYLYPSVMLKKRGLIGQISKPMLFTGSHSASVAKLESGEVDAIAVFADDKDGRISAWTKYASNKNRAPRVLWVSEPIPNDPFVVRADYYDQNPKLTHKIMFAMIDVIEKLQDKEEIKRFLGAQGLMPATTRQYDPVREMVKELDIKTE